MQRWLSYMTYFIFWGFPLSYKRLYFLFGRNRATERKRATEREGGEGGGEREGGRDWFSVLQLHALLLCLELQFRFRRQRGCNQEEVVINFSCLSVRVSVHECKCVCVLCPQLQSAHPWPVANKKSLREYSHCDAQQLTTLFITRLTFFANFLPSFFCSMSSVR